MATSLGIVDGDLVNPVLPTLPALPAFPGVPGFPTAPVSVPLPTTPDGNAVVPPAAVNPATPPAMVNPELLSPPPEPTFWDKHGGTVTGLFAVIGVIAVVKMVSSGGR